MVDDVVDVAALVAPLDTGDGAGENLQLDRTHASIFRQLRDARNAAMDEERIRDADPDADAVPIEGWRQVRRLAVELLSSQTKDFDIAAWLTEALVRQDGLPGLTSGARVMAGLLERHWDAGFPQPEPDDDETVTALRATSLGGLAGGDRDGTVMQALRRTPLFRRPSGDSLGLYQYEAAANTASIMDETRREQRYAQGVLPLETVETEGKFDRAGLSRIMAQATEARAAWQLFQDQLDARFGYDSPPTRRVAEVLERIVEVAGLLGGDSREPGAADTAPPAAEAAPGQPAMAAAAAAPAAAPAGSFVLPASSIAGREQALKVLEQIAEYFQKTEPHSFLAYTLADAVRRGRMSLPELLAEVMQDETARTSMLTALGIQPRAMDATE